MTITIIMGDGSQIQASDAQTAANAFAQGGEILTPTNGLYQPTEMAGAGTNPDGWLIQGVTLTDYFAPPTPTQGPGPTASTTVVQPTGPPPTTPGAPIYRIIIPWPDGTFATGANYPGCSQNSTAACDPKSFPTLNAAIQYALAGGEIPVLAQTVKESWDIVAGNEIPSGSQILALPPQYQPVEVPPPVMGTPGGPGLMDSLLSSPLAMGALGVGAYLAFFRKPKGNA